MTTIELLSLPQVFFAHSFDASTFHNFMRPSDSMIEFTYIYKGSFDLTHEGITETCEEGDVLINLYDNDRTINTKSYHCHHTVEARIEWIKGEDLPGGLYLPFRMPAKIVTPEIYKLVDDLIFLQNMQQLNSLRAKTEFLELLCQADSCNRKAHEVKIPNGIYHTNKAKKYISDHIRESITQKEIAEHLGITPGYLCDVFKESQGESLMHYINSIKLHNIRSLMENEKITLREASAAYGYSDPNYVSRLYKQLYGKNITLHM